MPTTLRSSTSLDRESDRRGDAAYLEALARAPTTRTLILVDEKPVIVSNAARTETSVRWFEAFELERLGLGRLPAMFLGIRSADGAAHFAVSLTAEEAARSEALQAATTPAVDLRSLATQGSMADEELSIAANAKALAAWHDASAFCGRCGGETAFAGGGWKRICGSCGSETFPRTDPVAIMLVTDGERCVLAHEERFPERMFSTIAGFIEPGEDLASAVRRETREELGLEVGEVRFLASQPWPFPHSLMLGCMAAVAPAELVVDRTEIAEARWFTRKEAGEMLAGNHPEGLWVPGRHAIAHILIRAFVEEGRGLLDAEIATMGALRAP